MMVTHETLSFWCDIYKSGTRITCSEGLFVFEAVDWPRIIKTKRFGLIESKLCIPSAELVAEVDEHKDKLIPFLSQPVPQKLAHWFYHPLYLDYEARFVATIGAKLGVAVYLRPCSLGIWPEVMGSIEVDHRPFTLPRLSPILQHAGYSYHREAYLID